MSESAIKSRLELACSEALKEIADFIEIDILDAFDSEHGYDSSGNKVPWPELSTAYVDQKPPRGRDGSAHPILNFEGDLRSSIKAVVEGFTLDTDVTNQKMKPRGKGSISVADISSILEGERPHTMPSPKWQSDSSNVVDIFKRYLGEAVDELRRDGIW